MANSEQATLELAPAVRMAASETPVIAVTGGRVRGTLEHGVHVFRGLPFAAPVAGRDRWRPPQPVVAWDGVRDATRSGAAARQPSGGFNPVRLKRTGRVFIDTIGDLGAGIGDDCLNLNVWTPSLDRQAKLPVAVWIHGGSFSAGSGAQPLYDGTAFAQKGVVLVTINYRLGLIGFMGGDDLFDGDMGVANRGFLDQVQALRWVAENITAFGGDPDQVTVMGESAGAASVIAMVSTPATDGLIRRAISFSGGPLAYPHQDMSRLAGDVFQTLGVKPGDSDALAALEPARLFAAQGKVLSLINKDRDRYGAIGAEHLAFFGMATGSALFPLEADAYLRAGNKPDLDLMIGTCRDEGRLWTICLPFPDPIAARIMFNLHSGLFDPKARLAAYRALMPGASGVAVREKAMSDAFFRKRSIAFADAHAAGRPGRTFVYRFDWASPALGGAFGCIHGLDIPGTFQTYQAALGLIGDEAAARPAGDALHAATVSFIKTGRPEILGHVGWPAYRQGLDGHQRPMRNRPSARRPVRSDLVSRDARFPVEG
jgi:para-nitrobenzyl esterase